jgi:hypothetical protein
LLRAWAGSGGQWAEEKKKEDEGKMRKKEKKGYEKRKGKK